MQKKRKRKDQRKPKVHLTKKKENQHQKSCTSSLFTVFLKNPFFFFF
jgi:hypothetical protein